jgi:hypothetical protein
MSDNATETNGMPLIQAIAGAVAGLGFSAWMIYVTFTEGAGSGQAWDYKWWGYLIFWGIVAAAFVKGAKCLTSVVYQIQRVPPEERYWREKNAEEKIWEIVGKIVGFGLLGFFLLISWDSASPSSKSITLGEGIIIALLIAVLYNQHRK